MPALLLIAHFAEYSRTASDLTAQRLG